MKNKKSGFTIIELAIVLVVVALLLAGIIGGQYLIEISRLQGLIKDINGYSAIHLRFQEKYKQLPGDMDNAFSIWGTDCAPDAGKCNGNGNLVYDDTESYKAWKHMQLSSLISQAFTAITLDFQQDCEVGGRFPKTSINGISFSFQNGEEEAEVLTTTINDGRTVLMRISGIALNCNPYTGDPMLNSEQMKYIDDKMDDGIAFSGKIITSQANPSCTDSITINDDANYVSNTAPVCLLWYRLKTF